MTKRSTLVVIDPDCPVPDMDIDLYIDRIPWVIVKCPACGSVLGEVPRGGTLRRICKCKAIVIVLTAA